MYTPRPTVLLVDDELDAIRGYGELLQERYRVILSSTVAQALRILRNEEVTVVVTDMRMPGQDGEDFLKIANVKHRGPIKIILSGYVDEFFNDRFQSTYHVFAVLRKPVPSRQFLRIIRNAIAEYEWRYSEKDEAASRYLSADQVMERMGISRPTLYKYLRAGLPSKRIGGRRLFAWQDICRWVDKRGSEFSKGGLQ